MRGLNVPGYTVISLVLSLLLYVHCILVEASPECCVYFRSFFMGVIERYVYNYTVHSYNSINCGVLFIRGTLEALRIKKM